MIVALTFVAAPFYLRQAQAAFAAVDPDLTAAARTLGAGEARAFWRVAIPCAGAGITTGMALAWGRALGEFGATLMFAGSFQGITQTAPLAIFATFARDFPAALALSAVLVAASGGAAAGGEAARPLAPARRRPGLTMGASRRARARIASALREFELEVELEVGSGTSLALVGPSGAGKSTVLRAIAGLHRPDRGRVGARRAPLARHRAPGSTCRRSGATAATCFSSTPCSRT